MTARPTSRPTAETTKGNPSRAKRSWPARLGTMDRWQIALRYALREKVEHIAAAYQVTTGYVTTCAVRHGLPRRGQFNRPANPADEQHLRRWAQRKAAALRREAAQWEALSTLE